MDYWVDDHRRSSRQGRRGARHSVKTAEEGDRGRHGNR